MGPNHKPAGARCASERPRLAVSSCLLGEHVRYDGDHRRSTVVTEVLDPWVFWVPVCPEVELGLGVPRPPIRLELASGGIQLRRVLDGEDLTARMGRYARKRAEALVSGGIDGFVLKARSPSCGLRAVPVRDGRGRSRPSGTGLFAAAVGSTDPTVPAEEEDRLEGAEAFDRFVERIFARRRLREFLGAAPDASRLQAFHQRHELQLLAHGPAGLRALDRLAARASASRAPARLIAGYARSFMAHLWRPLTAAGVARAFSAAAERIEAENDGLPAADLRAIVKKVAVDRKYTPVAAARFRERATDAGLRELAWQSHLSPDPGEAALRFDS